MTYDAPTVAVRGESLREVDPEIAEFSVTVSARDKDRATTLRRLSDRVAALRAVLDGYAEAIEKRETSRMSVYAETRRSGEKIAAYAGSATTTVTVTDLDAVGEMMLRAADAEQTQVNGPNWSVRPGSPVYREAREAAIADAVTRAREYAGALGARITGLVELTDNGLSSGGIAPQARFGAAGGMRMLSAAASTPELDLDPQRQQIHASVEARFTISDPSVLAEPLD